MARSFAQFQPRENQLVHFLFPSFFVGAIPLTKVSGSFHKNNEGLEGKYLCVVVVTAAGMQMYRNRSFARFREPSERFADAHQSMTLSPTAWLLCSRCLRMCMQVIGGRLRSLDLGFLVLRNRSVHNEAARATRPKTWTYELALHPPTEQ